MKFISKKSDIEKTWGNLDKAGLLTIRNNKWEKETKVLKSQRWNDQNSRILYVLNFFKRAYESMTVFIIFPLQSIFRSQTYQIWELSKDLII